jgi:hypothetical protein
MANLLYPASTGHNVDDKYSPLVEPNLFANNVFQPGLTYTDKYQLGPAGQIYVHKPGTGTVTPTTPGADFADSIVQDSLIPISLDKSFNRSRKLYNVTAASVAYAAAATEIELATKEVKEGWNLQAVKSLIGTTSILVSDNLTTLTATDGSDIYDQIVADRQKMRENKSKPNVLLATPKTYAKLLKAPEFQRTGAIGDATVAEGAVGRIAGMTVFEYESLDDAAVDAATIGGITWAAADELEYVMYDSDAFSIVSSINMARVKDSENFNGIKCQVEVVSGFKLTNPKRALLKFHDAA